MDEDQFHSLYDATKKQLWTYLVRLSGDTSIADDIFQETFVRLLQREGPALAESKMKPYLFSIATNLMRDHWRKSKRSRSWFTDNFENTPNYSVDVPGLRHEIEGAFRHLTPQERSLTWLAYVEGYTHREIAQILGVREKSVKVLLFRAKKRLVGILKTMGITSETIG
jgi:RNA polymerase sigma-70 factor, ECF subfamily